ncbi:MAG: hypothetical protein JW862_06515, partial [Anaerolineales bacterium]|nr:hypothetical protein [Anaerolineales bacterium]
MDTNHKLSVHLLSPPVPQDLNILLQELDPGITITSGQELPQPADYHILVAGRPDRRFLEASPNLHSLLIPFAGLPDSTRQLLQEFPQIAVHNLHYNATATAEMALALLFAAAKHLLPMDRALRSGDWRPRYDPLPSMLLQGKTALILGYGSIGRRVGQALQALGVQVLGVRRHPQSEVESGVAV